MYSTRKLRLICLAVSAMSDYLFVREVLHEDLQSCPGELDHDAEVFDMTMGYNHALLLVQFALLMSAAEPYLKSGVRYSVGHERYSFARIQRDMADTDTCKAVFRFALPELRQLYSLLKFPPIVKVANATATGEETFLYMLRRLAYPATQASLAMDCGRRPCEAKTAPPPLPPRALTSPTRMPLLPTRRQLA